MAGAFICPIFKFSAGSLFEIWNEIPCSNAIRVETFSIISDMYVAVANSRDSANNTETQTVVFKFDLNLDKFVSFQNILVNRIVDMRYFTFQIAGEVAHFLVITSTSLIDSNEVAEIQKEGYSVIIIYKYVEELFLPMQNIFIPKPTQVLPHIWNNKEMVLLIASETLPVQFYQYIGWKFEDSALSEAPVAFETGVSSLRNYVNTKGDSLILLSNTEHFGTMPNLFKIHFRVNEDPDLYQGILDWCEKSVEELQGFEYAKVIGQLEAIQAEQEKMLGDLMTLNKAVVLDSRNITVKQIITDDVQDPAFARDEESQRELTEIRETVAMMEEKLSVIGAKIGRSMTKADREMELRSAEAREIAIDELQVGRIEAKLVNGKPIDMWAHADQDLFVGSLSVDQITVHGAMNLQEYDEVLQSALKVTGDQVLAYPIVGDELSVSQLTVLESINDNDMQALTTALKEVSTNRDEISVDHMHVRNLHGLVNGKDFRDLDGIILKNIGDQTIDGWFQVENLVVGNSAEIVGNVSGHSLSQMITINDQEKELRFEKAVNFVNHVHFHDLHVQDRMGSVKVKKNGGFDVLLKRSNRTQLMCGETLFDTVKLLEPIMLHVRFCLCPFKI